MSSGKNQMESLPNLKNKKTIHFEQRRRGFKPNNSFGSKSQNFSKNNYQTTDFKNKVPQNTQEERKSDLSVFIPKFKDFNRTQVDDFKV